MRLIFQIILYDKKVMIIYENNITLKNKIKIKTKPCVFIIIYNKW